MNVLFLARDLIAVIQGTNSESASEFPGSVIGININIMKTPGAPRIRKAVRQFNHSAKVPPNKYPKAAPTGAEAPRIAKILFLCCGGKKLHNNAGAMTVKDASPNYIVEDNLSK